MAEKVAEYEMDGKKVQFKIRCIKYGEYQKVMGSMVPMELIGNVTKGKIDTFRLLDEIMKIAVTGVDGADYHQLDIVQGLDLQAKVLELNGMGGEQPFRPEPVR